jgi:parallel beta-helix repeat protein
MKKIFLVAIACFIFMASQSAIIQVNNNAGSTVTTLLQTAIDNANSGDTIYVAGSPNYYDEDATLILTKRLTIIGPGFFLGENSQTQSSNQTAKIYYLEIGEGADNSVIMGLDFVYSGREIQLNRTQRGGGSGAKGAENVVLRRNVVDRIYLEYGSGTVIEQNYFNRGSNYGIYLHHTSSNTIIQNNIINLRYTNSPCIKGYGNGVALSNTVIRNNTFSSELEELIGVEITNNIFFSAGLNDCDNNTLKNNVFVATKIVAIPTNSTGNTYEPHNNKFSVTAGDLFVKAIPALDNEFKLKGGSPATGAGIDGIDAGAFGGLNAYKLSGLPPIPSIYEVTSTGVGTKESGLKVVIKAKSNN